MAQINIENFKKVEKNRNSIHDKVTSTYTAFKSHRERYFQINTYGKNER